MTRRLLPLLLAIGLLVAVDASAEPSATDKSLAQSLFDQAKSLMRAKNYDEACPKFAESQRLDPGGGTLLNLALCHEQQGKLATAWSEFKGALSDAKRDGRQDRVTAAEDHIAALEPKLPWLTLAVSAEIDGQDVKLDGVSVGRAAWGTPVAVDPGSHEVVAEAPGYVAWKSPVELALAQKKTLTIPALERDPAAAATPSPETAPAAAPAPPRESSRGGMRTAGWIVAGSSVVAIGVGAFFGVRSLGQRKDSDALCPTDDTCTEEGKALNDQAYTSAWIANIGIGLGLVGVGVGTYLIIKGGGSDGAAAGAKHGLTLALGTGVAPGGGRVMLDGSW